jgi:hypothetical protein
MKERKGLTWKSVAIPSPLPLLGVLLAAVWLSTYFGRLSVRHAGKSHVQQRR